MIKPQHISRHFLAALLLAPLAALQAADAPKPANKPNILILLADDMGYGDPGCYNPKSKIATPISTDWPGKG